MGLAGLLLGNFWDRRTPVKVAPSMRRTVHLIFEPGQGWSWAKYGADGTRKDRGVATGLHLDAQTHAEAKRDEAKVRAWAKQEWPGHDFVVRIFTEAQMKKFYGE